MCKGSKNCCEKKKIVKIKLCILKGQDGIFRYITEFYGYKTMCHHPFLQHSAMCIFSKFKLSKHFFLLNSYFLLVNTFFSLLLNLSKCSTERKHNKIIIQTTKPTFLQKHFVYASIILKMPPIPCFHSLKRS